MIFLLSSTPILMQKRIVGASRRYQESEANVLTHTSEFLSNVISLRTLSAEHWAKNVLEENFKESCYNQLRLQVISSASQIGYLALWIVYGGTYFFAGLLTFQGILSAGDVLALGQLMASLAFPSQSLGSIYGSYNSALASLIRIEEFLSQEVLEIFHKPNGIESYQNEQKDTPLPLVCCQAGVVIENKTIVLQDINLTVNYGDWVAVAGPSGAGKSTLMQLLAGLRTPTSGHVLAGEKSLANWNEKVFRQSVGFAGGDVHVYKGSLFDNVALGRSQISPEVATSLLVMVGATNIITRFGGIHNSIVERKNLSSGERQRIGLARALATNPKLLLLDEATNAIDSQSEEFIFEKIRGRFPNITVLLISHRLSTILKCSRIVVIDQGKIREEGSPFKLLSQEGAFKTLIQSQVVNSNQ